VPATIFAAALMVLYRVMLLVPAFMLGRGRQPIRVAAILFTCAIVASYVSANRHAMPILERNAADRGLILMAGWLGVLLLAADGIERADRLRILIRRIVMDVTAMAVLGIIQFATAFDATRYISIPGFSQQIVYSDVSSSHGLNRPAATAAHPLEFAAALAMSLPLAIHQARFAPPGLRLRRWLQVALIGIAMPMTVSRTAILGIAIVGIVILPTWPKRHRRFAYLALLLALVAIFVMIPGMLGTFRSLFSEVVGGSSSTQSRIGAYSLGAPLIAKHPWFGVGFGTLLPQTYFFTDDQYLSSIITTGVVGLLALLALFATGWRVARSARRATVDADTRDLAQSLAASVAVAAVCFATFDALAFSIAAGLAFLLLGCVGALWRLVREQVAE
jgi:O-antigen ligase